MALRFARGFRLGFLLKAVLAAYVLTVALLPLSHHDVACHLKSTTHCTTCVAGSTAETTSHAATLSNAPLTDVGRANTDPAGHSGSAPLTSSSGRSPPLS